MTKTDVCICLMVAALSLAAAWLYNQERQVTPCHIGAIFGVCDYE